jgi:hypothetical protein
MSWFSFQTRNNPATSSSNLQQPQPIPQQPVVAPTPPGTSTNVNTIKQMYINAKNFVTSASFSEQVKDRAILFLQLVESTATLIPVFGPVVVLAAQMTEYSFIREELKEKLTSFSNEINEYDSIIQTVVSDLNNLCNKILKFQNFNPDKLNNHKEYMLRIADLIKIDINDCYAYLVKIIKDAETNSRVTSMTVGEKSIQTNKEYKLSIDSLTSTTTMSSNIDSYRVSIINKLILLLFRIDSIFIESIGALSDKTIELQNNTEKMIDDIKNITDTLAVIDNKLKGIIVDDTNKIRDSISKSSENNRTIGGYKFKSKKIKRKLKNKRKTNKRNKKNKRKSKKHIKL